MGLTVGGHGLYAEWLEPADGPVPGAPPLVFLHEGLGSVAQWTDRRGLDVPATLVAATGSPALVYDRLGFGRSDPLPGPRRPDYLYDEAWQTLPAVLDQAGIDRALPVGHSDGATIALLFAARFPDRAAALVGEAAHVFVEDVTLDGIRDASRRYRASNGTLKAALTRYHGTKTDATFAGWADVWLEPEFRAFDMVDRLAAIACPVFALQGDGDEYGSPAQLTAIRDGVSGPVETWLVPRCRHVPHFQAADRVLPRIAAFVRRMADADAGIRPPARDV